jgi:uncharacterized membrane protein HdeD (DUF308 family)
VTVAVSVLEDLRETSGRPSSRLWWWVTIVGAEWIIFAIVILRFDDTSIAAVSVLFGVVSLGAAGTEVAAAGISSGGRRIWHYVLVGLFTVVGITSFLRPGDTFRSIAALMSFFLFFRGITDLFLAFSSAGDAASPRVFVFTGIVELFLGFWAAGSWGLSATVLIAWVGAAALLHGVSDLAYAFALRPQKHGRSDD